MNISRDSLRRSLTRRSLGGFATSMMPAFDLAPCHKLIITKLEKLLAGGIHKLAIITPPRHGKSTLGNVMLPAFALGRNPRETIITVSYGADLAETFGRRVKNILADPAFHELFPGCQLSPESTAASHFELTAGGEYTAVGRGGPVTGRGASLLILDDLLKDAEEANSERTCRTIIDWLESVAFTRLTPRGRVLAIATRWSERDPMGWLMQQTGWTVLHLAALAQENDPLGRTPGEALWPSHYTAEALEKIRTDVGSRVFQCLYQGNVVAAQGTIFKRDWFRRYPPTSELKFSRVIQSWDTSFKTGATNDYSVCATFGEASNGFYLRSLYRAKIEFPELKKKVAQLADAWRPERILIEDRASGQSLVQELILSTSYPIVPIKVDRDKETRASAVTGYFEAGRIFFPEGAAWLADLEDELASFPGAVHDDCVDAITQALNYLRPVGGAYGFIEYLKKLAGHGQECTGSGPFQPLITGGRTAEKEAEACPKCGARSPWQKCSTDLRCQQCGHQRPNPESVQAEGIVPVTPNEHPKECTNPLLVMAGGHQHCNSCGWDEGRRATEPVHQPRLSASWRGGRPRGPGRIPPDWGYVDIPGRKTRRW